MHILYRQLALNFFILILPSQAWAYVTNNKRRKEVERWKEGYTTTAQINMIQTTRQCVSGFSAVTMERLRRGTIVTGAWTKRRKRKGREIHMLTKTSQRGERLTQSFMTKLTQHKCMKERAEDNLGCTPTRAGQTVSTAYDGRALHKCKEIDHWPSSCGWLEYWS